MATIATQTPSPGDSQDGDQLSSRWSVLRSALPLVVIPLALFVSAAVLVHRHSPHEQTGPHAKEDWSVIYVTGLNGGDSLTYGGAEIPNPDRLPMKVVDVRVNSAHLDVTSVVAVLPRERERYGRYSAGWGSARAVVPVDRPAIGHQLTGNDFEGSRTHALQLLIGLRTTNGAELAGLNGVEVVFERGGKRHTEDFPGAFVVCAGRLDAECDKRDEEADLRSLGLLK